MQQAASGRLKWQVVDGATGEVVRDSGPDWIKNLILNAGMDEVAVKTWVDCFQYAIAGTGVTPTSVDSATTTATLSAGSVAASAPFFSAGQVGASIKWDDGTSGLITGYTDSQHVAVNNILSVEAGSHFILYNTNQTQLASEVKRTNSYLTTTGACGSVWVGNTVQNQRTYNFSIESSPVTYTEIGFGWSSGGPNNTFSRILLPAGVLIAVGQQLRVIYQLWVTLGPAVTTARTAAISGWDSPTGKECIQYQGLYAVNSNGTSGGQTFSEPSTGFSTANAFIGTDATAPAAFGSTVSRVGTNYYPDTVTRAAYVSGSYVVTISLFWSVGNAVNSSLSSFGVGYYNSPPQPWQSTYYVFVFDTPQAKDSAHTLTLVLQYAWSRVLA